MSAAGAAAGGAKQSGDPDGAAALWQEWLPAGARPDLPALLEALLIAAQEPVTAAALATAAGTEESVVAAVLAAMGERADRGYVVIAHQGAYQLATAPRFSAEVRRLLRLERETRLSAAALETLALVAYRQPITRGELETIRGVDCTGVLATLHERGLIDAVGRRATVGHPIEYGTTPAFLRHFGLTALSDLPPLGEVGGRDPGGLLDAVLGDGSDREE